MQDLFSQFYQEYNGKFWDFDGVDGATCVDLVQFWNKALNNPTVFTGNADDIYNQAGTFFTQVPNSPTNFPSQGDIVVWSSAYNGTFGHCGIATGNGNTQWFECFEQNDPLGTYSHNRTYSYTDVLGWLHPISISADPNCLVPNTSAWRQTYTNLVTEATNWKTLVQANVFNPTIVLDDPTGGSKAVQQIQQLQKPSLLTRLLK